jgi:hypothetical protein
MLLPNPGYTAPQHSLSENIDYVREKHKPLQQQIKDLQT